MNISGMVLGLIGGLGLFLYGMTLMMTVWRRQPVPNSVSILELFTKNRYVVSLWALCLRRYTVLQCCNGYGCQLCKCRS